MVHLTYESCLIMAVTVGETVGDNPGDACSWRKSECSGSDWYAEVCVHLYFFVLYERPPHTKVDVCVCVCVHERNVAS
jgi:hypothetical protein